MARPLLAGWLVVVAVLTLRNDPAAAARVAETPWSCILCGDAGGTDFFLNLLLFLPFGLLARAAGWRLGRLALCALALTIAIEVTQGTLLVGRDAALGDVVANTDGAMVGWWLFRGIVALTRPTPPEAVRATMVLLVVHLLLWAGTGAALRPALTGPEPWVGQLRHARPGQPRYPGTLSDVRINGVPVENDPLATIPRPSGSVDFGFTTALPVDSLPATPVTIARIVDGHQQPVVGVGARGHDATFEVRLQASRWRLRTPGWRFPGALAISPSTPWSFHWRLLHDRIEMRDGAVGGPERVVRLPLSLGIGWIFVHPFVSVVGPGAPWWTVAWLGWWFALLGWFGGATGRWLGVGAGAAGLLLLLVVARADTLPVPPLEGATATIATVAGLLLGRRHAARSR